MNSPFPSHAAKEAPLLRLLFQTPSDFLSRTYLLQKLSCPESTLSALLQTLTTWGYSIETHPTHGIRLLQRSFSLHLDEVRTQLPLDFTWSLFHLNETQSTMDFIKREGLQGAPHGTLVIANTQTAGRGRHGRIWSSRPELGLYLSLLLRPDFPVDSYSRLTIIAAVSTLQTAERLTHLDLQIKWPNDLMIEKRKLAGILTESHLDQFQNPFAILGLGINLTHQSTDFPEELQTKASSLLIESNQIIRRADFLVDWIQTFQKNLSRPFNEMIELWKLKCLNLGQSILVNTAQGPIQGTALDLESNGTLLLRDDHGKIHSILSGIVDL